MQPPALTAAHHPIPALGNVLFDHLVLYRAQIPRKAVMEAIATTQYSFAGESCNRALAKELASCVRPLLAPASAPALQGAATAAQAVAVIAAAQLMPRVSCSRNCCRQSSVQPSTATYASTASAQSPVHSRTDEGNDFTQSAYCRLRESEKTFVLPAMPHTGSSGPLSVWRGSQPAAQHCSHCRSMLLHCLGNSEVKHLRVIDHSKQSVLKLA